ncbi:MAG TPA: YihY/virulence factor BrkB family protein [Solirubrobacteraceae bacterium]|jgi:YihY family inner membrane protein|nr:YihY/virulence factor BrkB family protein [Solirubrobacteraceae bacterium]
MSRLRGAIAAFDRFQQRTPPLAVLFAVLKKFSDDGAGNQAALIAYYGFFSLFPLLLVFTTILGYVLAGDPSAQASVQHSVLAQIPLVGFQPHSLTGKPVALVVGLVGALLSGLGVTMATQNAFNTVYAVPRKERPNFLSARWRSLKLLIFFGLLQLISTAVAGLVAGGIGGIALTIAGLVVALLVNLVLFYAVFRFMTDDSVATSELRAGIAIAAVAWEVLQAVGGIYVKHVLKGDTKTYGAFATVIGLLVWLYLGARVVVYSAEINVVLKRRLWPRSLLSDPPLPADRRARAALAKTEERDDTESIDVVFHPNQKTAGGADDPDYAVAPHPAPGERARSAQWPERDEETEAGQPPFLGGDAG